MEKRIRSLDPAGPLPGPLVSWPAAVKHAFRLVMASSQPAYVAWGPDLRFFYNDAYIPLLGEKHPQAWAAPFWKVFAEIKPALGEKIDAVRSGQACVIESVPHKIDGPGNPDTAILAFSLMPIRNPGNQVIGIFAAGIDVTKPMQMEKRFKKIVEQAATGVVEIDAQGTITLVNRKFGAMLGYQESELLGRSIVGITAPGSVAETLEAVAKLAAGEPDFVIEKQYVRKDGSLMWAVSSVSALRGADRGYQGLVAIVVDITARKLAEEGVRYAALHDLLTGLPNRAMLFEYASHLLPHIRRNNQRAAVLFLDLDRFKPINDTHGHETGDAILREVARRLAANLRSEDIVIRLGGDEFVILLQEIQDAIYSAEIAQHLICGMNEPCRIGELSLSLSASIGISIFPDDGNDIGTLISRADTAMYQAKQSGRNNFQFYCAEYDVRAKRQLTIEQQLKRTLKNDSFHLCYQPVVDIEGGEVVSVEALLRWRNKEIGPDQFVPIAEATGIINPIGQWIVGQAARQYKTWMDHGLPAIPIAVNVSGVEFRDKNFARRFEATLCENGVATDALQLEVTETAAMDDLEHTIKMLSHLKLLGVKVSLDDFGTGYSSLSHLARLPLNKVKIDKSFVFPVVSDITSRAITDAVIALGKTLNLDVVAEGVESEAILRYLGSQGCTQAQGYYFSKPMSGDEFENWYREYGKNPKGSRQHLLM